MSSASTSLWYKERRTVQRTWTALPIHGWSRRRNARALGACCIALARAAGQREMATRGALVNGNPPHASGAPGVAAARRGAYALERDEPAAAPCRARSLPRGSRRPLRLLRGRWRRRARERAAARPG